MHGASIPVDKRHKAPTRNVRFLAVLDPEDPTLTP
jgi:hypothetical protein